MGGALEELLAEMVAEPRYAGQLAYLAEQPGRPGEYGELPAGVAPAVREILRAQGLERLYRHQAQAVEAILGGRHVVIAAGTAAGKTLCYVLPVVQALAEDKQARALLLYPTKALAQDQLRKLREFGAGSAFVAETYDGDTPQHRRREIRRQTQVILSNPDMLHVGMLPRHTSWGEFFRHLKYVVVDEVHVYRGVFGSHVANVFRRLRRLCEEYGSAPQFVCTSATIGNPGELAGQLTGEECEVIAWDSAPRGRRFFAFWNPPLVEEETGRRRSTNQEAADLLVRLLRREIRTIVFALSRMQAELILRYARDRLSGERELQGRLAPYRGGYLPEERREIERRLFEGELLGVVATSALELGVDIGGLDAVIMAGYPGSVSSALQQAGRAGRGGQDALAVLVPTGGGIDQYLMEHPEYLLEANQERGACFPDNRFILGAHLLCAAYEQPLEPEDRRYFGPQMEELLRVFTQHGLLDRRRRWYWADGERYPAAEFSLRSGAGRGYEIVLEKEQRLLGTVDEGAALWLVHPGAVYLHAGESYVVRELDLVGQRAVVRPQRVSYYTRAMATDETRLLDRYEERALKGKGKAWLGEVEVTTQILGYRRLRLATGQELDTHPLELPERRFETVGVWVELGEGAQELAAEGHDLLGSLHALEHALINLFPLIVLCDPHDVGGVSYAAHPQLGGATLFLYDGYPGGVGLAERAYDHLAELLEATAQRIEKCPCLAGCPGCVQSPSCGNSNRPLDKAGAAALARKWLGEE